MKAVLIIAGLLLGASVSEARPKLVRNTYIKQVRVNKNPNSINLLVGKSRTNISRDSSIYGERITEVGYQPDLGLQYTRRFGVVNLGGAVMWRDSGYLSVGFNF